MTCRRFWGGGLFLWGWGTFVLLFEGAGVPPDPLGLGRPQGGALGATGERRGARRGVRWGRRGGAGGWGAVVGTGGGREAFGVVDGDGRVVAAGAEFFCDLQAAGRPDSTVRSYGLDLLRWFRFLWAVGVPWERATRAEARDFCRWMTVTGKPSRGQGAGAREPYSASVRAHAETVL